MTAPAEKRTFDFDMCKKRITILLLWLMAWGGLYTGLYNVLNSDFLRDPVVLFHGLRAFFPLAAGLAASFLLIQKRAALPRLGPLTLFGIYGLIGIPATLFSPDPLYGAYWCLMYLAVITILWASLDALPFVIALNLTIAALLSLYFLIGPMRSQLLAIIQSGKPTLAAFGLDIGLFGLGPESANGIGRFAVVSAIAAFARIDRADKRIFLWALLFVAALVTLIVSQSRSALIGFALALGVILWLRQRRWGFVWLGLGLALLVWIMLFVWTSPRLTPEGGVEYVRRGDWQVVFADILGRAGTWRQGIELVARAPIIGLGFQADRLALAGQHMHNAFMQALVQTGIAGTAVFLAAWLWAWRIALRFLANGGKTVLEKHGALVAESIALLAFFTFRSLFESTAAFYGVDLIMLLPIVAFIERE